MTNIKRLPLELIPRAATLLARAFSSDPILTLFLDDPTRRARAFPAFFRALLCEAWEAGHIYAAHEAGRFVGVAVWIPPCGAQPSTAFERRAWRNHAFVKSLFGRRAEAMYRGFANTAGLHPKQPHWYLFFIGVHPAFQGRGIGRRLLEPVLRRADRERVLCYLEKRLLPQPTNSTGVWDSGCALEPFHSKPHPSCGPWYENHGAQHHEHRSRAS